ncbi:MAG: hypothetical protein HRU38_23970 [Saccharospirillaceae bacterium]|nr:hypothetical protein [Pseudomonadales bacterium]NRB81680.1 hypothetical protein [Saccharospirillaceae bacterium]
MINWYSSNGISYKNETKEKSTSSNVQQFDALGRLETSYSLSGSVLTQTTNTYEGNLKIQEKSTKWTEASGGSVILENYGQDITTNFGDFERQETSKVYQYDANGNLRFELINPTGDEDYIKDQDSVEHWYNYNNDNQIIDRLVRGGEYDPPDNTGGAEAVPLAGPNGSNGRYFYANGNQIGKAEYSLDDEGNTEDLLTIELATGSFRQVQTVDRENPGNGQTRYTAQGGESLQMVAQNVYGNSNLWFLIAEANGLDATSTLVEGQFVLIPPGLESAKLDADSHLLYDASGITGVGFPHENKELTLIQILVSTFVAAVLSKVADGILLYIQAQFGNNPWINALAGAIIKTAERLINMYVEVQLGMRSEFPTGDELLDEIVLAAKEGAKWGFERTNIGLKIGVAGFNAIEENIKVEEGGSLLKLDGVSLDFDKAIDDFGEDFTQIILDEVGLGFVTPWMGILEKFANDEVITGEDWYGAINATFSAAINKFVKSDALKLVLNIAAVEASMALTDDIIDETGGQSFTDYQKMSMRATGYAQALGDYVGGKVAAPINAETAKIYRAREMQFNAESRGRGMAAAAQQKADDLKYEDEVEEFGVAVAENRRFARQIIRSGEALTPEQQRLVEKQISEGKWDGGVSIEELNEGVSGYNIGDKATISKDLALKALFSGDAKDDAELVGFYIEEFYHSMVNQFEVDGDFEGDEGKQAAQNFLKSMQGGAGFSATLNLGGQYEQFNVDSSVLGGVIKEHFNDKLIKADHKLGDIEFGSNVDQASKVFKKSFGHRMSEWTRGSTGSNPIYKVKLPDEMTGEELHKLYTDFDQAIIDGASGSELLEMRKKMSAVYSAFGYSEKASDVRLKHEQTYMTRDGNSTLTPQEWEQRQRNKKLHTTIGNVLIAPMAAAAAIPVAAEVGITTLATIIAAPELIEAGFASAKDLLSITNAKEELVRIQEEIMGLDLAGVDDPFSNRLFADLFSEGMEYGVKIEDTLKALSVRGVNTAIKKVPGLGKLIPDKLINKLVKMEDGDKGDRGEAAFGILANALATEDGTGLFKEVIQFGVRSDKKNGIDYTIKTNNDKYIDFEIKMSTSVTKATGVGTFQPLKKDQQNVDTFVQSRLAKVVDSDTNEAQHELYEEAKLRLDEFEADDKLKAKGYYIAGRNIYSKKNMNDRRYGIEVQVRHWNADAGKQKSQVR